MNPTLLQQHLNRTELLALPLNDGAQRIRISVHRNHNFELTEAVLNPFLDFSGLRAECVYSPYDDSFSFAVPLEPADLHLIWLDDARYADVDGVAWLRARLAHLKSLSEAPILVAHTGERDFCALQMPDVLVANLSNVFAQLGKRAFAPERERYAGTRLSNQAMLLAARALGLRLIPALLRPALKAIILDLDNTLYKGVLGEDGVSAVLPYEHMQRHLRQLKEQGFMLAIASKNEAEDVEALFAQRTDFPLQAADFATMAIGWKPKSEGIADIAATLNIGVDAMLFVDDNPGEIDMVKRCHPTIQTLEAHDPERTFQALQFYPGLLKTRRTAEDTLRNDDIKANAERERLIKTLAPSKYFADLHIALTYQIDPLEQGARVAELLRKTNQFILSFRRFDETQVLDLMRNGDACVVTVGMADRLSDSGIIAIIVGQRRDDQVVIDEVVVSCRALGRNIEGPMLLKGFEIILEQIGPATGLCVPWRKGPRNAPALHWLGGLHSLSGEDQGEVVLTGLPDFELNGVTINMPGGAHCL